MQQFRTVPLIVATFSLFASLSSADQLPRRETAAEAVRAVFAPPQRIKVRISPFDDYATEALVRPLRKETFEPLRKYFSERQRRQIDQVFRALDDLITTTSRIAKRHDFVRSAISLPFDTEMLLSARLRGDQLTGRPGYADVKKMRIGQPRETLRTMRVSVSEQYDDVGQDKVFGVSKKTSDVILVPENSRWAIDEVQSTIVYPPVSPNGSLRNSTLTTELRDLRSQLENAKQQLQEAAKRFEIRHAKRP